MQASLLHQLHFRRFSIRARWEALLRAEPVTTPLALPDALVHLIDTTLDEILSELAHPPAADQRASTNHHDASACCGRNPYLAYFTAAQQAMQEGLVLAQAASAPLDPRDRDGSLAELDAVLDRISRREIEAFCGVCQFRHLALPAPEQTLAIQGW